MELKILDRHKTIDSLELVINETQKALDRECLFAALALVLMIPDLCGKCLYPDIETSKCRYIKWFNQYVDDDEEDTNEFKVPYLTGKLLYKFRCAYLHAGNSSEVDRFKYKDFDLNRFIVRVESKKKYITTLEEATFDDKFKEYIINIRYLADLILSSAKRTLEDIKKDKRIKVENIKIIDADEERLKMRISDEETRSLNNLNPKEHHMRLNSDSFMKIKSGRKRVEMRLEDEKRQMLAVGDIIIFEDINTKEKITTKIIKITHFKNFCDLYDYYQDKTLLGYEEGERCGPYDMLKYYDIEDINQYGVVGIEIEVIE